MPTARKAFVLVIGTGFAGRAKRRVARMIATTLVDAGFGLVSGKSANDPNKCRPARR
jgi:hypothetical protein